MPPAPLLKFTRHVRPVGDNTVAWRKQQLAARLESVVTQISPREILAAIHAPPPPSASAEAVRLSTLSLTAVLLLAPLVAAAAAVAAWTAGFFWFFACVVGNPEGPPDEEDGREGRRRRRARRRGDEEQLGPARRADDGRGAVLWVRKWWKAWLASSYEDRG